jgi:hypothetical protein
MQRQSVLFVSAWCAAVMRGRDQKQLGQEMAATAMCSCSACVQAARTIKTAAARQVVGARTGENSSVPAPVGIIALAPTWRGCRRPLLLLPAPVWPPE